MSSTIKDRMTIIEDGINYGLSLCGIKYAWWTLEMQTTNYPIYGIDGDPPCIDFLKKKGIACSGLINLIRRHLKLSIPQFSTFPGGTEAWYRKLKVNNFLQTFYLDQQIKYPRGALLITRYKGPLDQGNMEIVLEHTDNEITLLCSTHEKGVTVEKFLLKEQVYFDQFNIETEFVCFPENWLTQN